MSQTVSIIDVFLWLIIGLGAWTVYQKLDTKLSYATVTVMPTSAPAPMPTAPTAPQFNLPSDWYYTPSVHTNRRPATQSTFPPPPTYPWTEADFQKWTEQIKIIARNNATYKSGR